MPPIGRLLTMFHCTIFQTILIRKFLKFFVKLKKLIVECILLFGSFDRVQSFSFLRCLLDLVRFELLSVNLYFSFYDVGSSVLF